MSRKKAFALDPLEVVNRFIAAANRHDADGVAACVHREFESLQPIHPVRNFRGSAQLLANWKAIFRNEPGFRLTMLRSAVDDDTVWVELHGAGQEAEVAGIFIIGVENGLIRWARVYSELVEPAPEPVVEAVATGTDDAVASSDDSEEGEDAGGERRLRLVEDAEEPAVADEEETVEPETAESEAADEEAADSEVAAEAAEGEVAEAEAAEEEGAEAVAEEEVAEAEAAEAEVAEADVDEAEVAEAEVAEAEVAEDEAGQSDASEDEAADLAEAATEAAAGPPDAEDEASETAETAVEAESEAPDADDEAGSGDQASEAELEDEDADQSEPETAASTEADRDAHIIAQATKPPAKPHKDRPRGRRRKGRRRK